MKWNGNNLENQTVVLAICLSVWIVQLQSVSSMRRLLSILKLDKLCNERLLKPLEESNKIILSRMSRFRNYKVFFHNLYNYMMLKMDF